MVKVKRVPVKVDSTASKVPAKSMKKKPKKIKVANLNLAVVKGIVKKGNKKDANTPSKRVHFEGDVNDDLSGSDASEPDLFDELEEGDALAFEDPIFEEENDENLMAEEKAFLNKARKGESIPIVTEPIDDDDDDDDELELDEDETDVSDEAHLKTLKKLKDNDPEFYKFLEQNEADLLEFGAEDNEIEADEEDDIGESFKKSGGKQIKVTEQLLADWSEKLQEKADRDTIKNIIEVFKTAVAQIAGEEVDGPFKVEGSEMFNSIVRLCFVDLLPAFCKFLHLPAPTEKQAETGKSVNPSKSNAWKKLVSPIKTYLNYIVKVLDVVSEDTVLSSLLRHCLHLVPFISCFLPITKRFLMKVTQLWSEGEEQVRVLSFLCILRLMRDQEPAVLGYILKKLYLSYAKNCKQTTPQTWPLINFMKQSLVELYSLDQGIAYQQAFVFIRQCAIHLRNAMTGSKKDGHKAVYNWHYVHSLLLWQQMICCLTPSDVLKQLVYPLVQVIIGTIKLVPIPQFYPLRFHLIRALIKLSSKTNTFIPIIPLILKPLEQLDYKKKLKASDIKKPDFNCLLKVAKNQVREKEFRDETVKTVYELLLEYLSEESHSVAFPELSFTASLKIKKFLKDDCKSADDSRLLRQALDKIEENVKFIEEKRKGINFKLNNVNEIESWEMQRKDEGTPISKFYLKLRSLRLDNERKEIEHDLPIAAAKKNKKKANKNGIASAVNADGDNKRKERDDEDKEEEEETLEQVALKAEKKKTRKFKGNNKKKFKKSKA